MLLFSCDQQNFQNIDNVISQLKSFEISDCVAHDVNQALPSGVIAYEFCNIEDKWDIKIHLYEVDAEDTCRKHIRCLQSMKYYEEWEVFCKKMENLSLKNSLALEELLNIDGIGLKSVNELRLFFSNNESLKIIYELPKLIEIEKFQLKNIESSISNMSIVFTGTLETMSRSEAKSIAKKTFL